MPRPKANLLGKKYGMLLVIADAGSNDSGRAMWRCKCDCGNECILPTVTLTTGHKDHCGCQTKRLMSEAAKKRMEERGIKAHGDSNSRLYRVFIGMIDRCERKSHKAYKRYGGRGIKVCAEWRHDYSAFKEWALANGYDENAEHGECTIDRIDNDGDYSPNNCRFVDMKVQNNNSSSTRLITIDGTAKPLMEWCMLYNINPKTVRGRLHRGWEPSEAITKPARHEYASKGK